MKIEGAIVRVFSEDEGPREVSAIVEVEGGKTTMWFPTLEVKNGDTIILEVPIHSND